MGVGAREEVAVAKAATETRAAGVGGHAAGVMGCGLRVARMKVSSPNSSGPAISMVPKRGRKAAVWARSAATSLESTGLIRTGATQMFQSCVAVSAIPPADSKNCVARMTE
ncbi:hypothetical protein GCM10010121_057260 [Streptomyces brasiliensis]|uniref:Uncharacterized protein n=1 Tax=Streptomyces brasiliensis TaxID=1954 RepID=A0A917NXR0_9ACTN|nr:hypothetical protein GCM10010121_057260 [Streptomyces brasiliensis]